LVSRERSRFCFSSFRSSLLVVLGRPLGCWLGVVRWCQ
jgi:hypothetical protein